MKKDTSTKTSRRDTSRPLSTLEIEMVAGGDLEERIAELEATTARRSGYTKLSSVQYSRFKLVDNSSAVPTT